MRTRPEYPDTLGYGLRAKCEIVIDAPRDVSPGVYSGEASPEPRALVTVVSTDTLVPFVVAYGVQKREGVGKLVCREGLTSHQLQAIDVYMNEDARHRLPSYGVDCPPSDAPTGPTDPSPNKLPPNCS